MESIESLKSKLISDDPEVLTLCEQYLDQRIEKERLRGGAAENRANIMLAASGAASAFLISFTDKLPDVINYNENALIFLIYAACALWLSKSVWYSVKSINVQSRKFVLANSIFEFQKNNKLDTLKYIISSKMWELDHSIQPNTERLFYVQRAQRALIVVIALLLVEGLMLSIKDIIPIKPSTCITVIFTLLSISFFFFGDKFIEKRGIWNHD